MQGSPPPSLFPLGGLHHLSDVSSLGRLHSLNLTECYNIRDVTALGKVHCLELSNSQCPGLGIGGGEERDQALRRSYYKRGLGRAEGAARQRTGQTGHEQA